MGTLTTESSVQVLHAECQLHRPGQATASEFQFILESWSEFCYQRKMKTELVLVLLSVVVRGTLSKNCCYPEKFEIGEGTQIGFNEGGINHYIGTLSHIAMDRANKRVGAFVSGVFDDKSFFFQIIQEYGTGVQYFIKLEKQKCARTELKGPMPDCVPDKAIPSGVFYIGDNKLTLDAFAYQVDQEQSAQGHMTETVTKDSCIPNSVSFVGKVAQASLLGTAGYFNYTSGISNPDAFFNVPSYCPNSTYNKEPEKLNIRNPMLFW